MYRKYTTMNKTKKNGNSALAWLSANVFPDTSYVQERHTRYLVPGMCQVSLLLVYQAITLTGIWADPRTKQSRRAGRSTLLLYQRVPRVCTRAGAGCMQNRDFVVRHEKQYSTWYILWYIAAGV